MKAGPAAGLRRTWLRAIDLVQARLDRTPDGTPGSDGPDGPDPRRSWPQRLLIAFNVLFVVGLLLVGALIVIPVLISLRVTQGLTRTVVASSIIGIFVAVTGMVVAFYADIAPGGSGGLTAIGLLVIVEAVAVARRLSNRSKNHQAVEMQQHAHAHESHAHGSDDDPEEGVNAGTQSHR